MTTIWTPSGHRKVVPGRTVAHLTDRNLLKAQAELGLTDIWYLSTEILELQDEIPRTREEMEPIQIWFDQERPDSLPAIARWLRFWSSPRFTGKTFAMLVYFFKRILKNVNLRVILQGQEKQNAVDSLKLLQAWFTLPKIEQLYGVFVSDEWGKEEFTIAQRTKARRDPTVRALGLEVPQQGKRCDIMGWDDLIGETNNTDDGIRKVERRISSSIPVIRQGGEGLFDCTRWSAFGPESEGETVSGNPGILKLWREGQLWHAPAPRGWFGAYAQPGDEVIFPHAKPGEPLFPGVLPEVSIQEARVAMSHSMFHSQILNNPLTGDNRYFSLDDIQYAKLFQDDGKPGELLAGGIPYAAIDPNRGGQPSAKTDETAIAVGYIKWQDRIATGYLCEWISGRWLPDKTYQVLLEVLRAYRPRQIFVEVNIGGEYFLESFRKRARDEGFDYLPLKPIHQSAQGTGKKVARIEGMQEHYRYRRIWHDVKLRSSKGEIQLLNWTRGGSGPDDLVDVLAMWFLEATKLFVEPQLPRGRRIGKQNLYPAPQYRFTGV